MNLLEYISSTVTWLSTQNGSNTPNNGIKSLLLDSPNLSTLGIACPQSSIMRKGILLFENLDDPVPCADRLAFVSCIVVMRPSQENVRKLARELSRPRYGSYRVCLTHRMNRLLIKELAEADTNELVSSVEEIPLDFRPLEAHLFVLSDKAGQCSNERALEGVTALLGAMNFGEFRMCFPRNSEACHRLAPLIRQAQPLNNLSRSSVQGTVLLLDRRFDTTTPLLNPWTYQAMIHEAFGINKNLVDMSGCEGITRDMAQIVLASDVDTFFAANLYKNFGEIGEIVQTLVTEYQANVQNHKNISSIGDIKDFVTNYPEFKKISGTVSKHVNLISELSRIVAGEKLLTISEVEQSLCCDTFTDTKAILEPLAEIKESISKVNGRRIMMLCLLRNKFNVEKTKSDVAHLFKGLDVEVTLQALKSYAGKVDTRTESGVTPLNRRQFFRGLKGIENVYTRHEPTLKLLLQDYLQGRPLEGFEGDNRLANKAAPILVYIIGGITYQESKVVHDLNVQHGTNIILGGCTLWNSKSFIDYVVGLI